MKRILVAEDDPDVASFLTTLLESAGHQIVRAEDGERALAIYQREGADIVVLDVLLPGRNGFQVAESIRAGETGADVPIVMLSGVYRGAAYRDQARRRFGAVEYLEKPVEADRLMAAILAAMEPAARRVPIAPQRAALAGDPAIPTARMDEDDDVEDERTDLSAEIPTASLPTLRDADAPKSSDVDAAMGGSPGAPRSLLESAKALVQPEGADRDRSAFDPGQVGETAKLLSALKSRSPEATDSAKAPPYRPRDEAPASMAPVSEPLPPQASAAPPPPWRPSPPSGSLPAVDGSPQLADPASLREKRLVERSVRVVRGAAQGDLKNTPFPVVLHRLYRERASGALLLVRDPVKKIVYFRSGFPVYVKSNLLSECLGKVLVRERLITEPQCRESLRLLQETKRQQGSLLIQLGALSQQNLVYGLQLQLRTKLYEIFAWPTGEYRFSSRTRVPADVTQLEMSTPEIIFDGVRLYFDPERLKQELAPSLDLYVRPTRDAGRKIGELPLTPADRLVVAAINGNRTVRELLARAAAGPGAAAQLIYSLLCSGFIDSHTQPVATEAVLLLPPGSPPTPIPTAQAKKSTPGSTPLPAEVPEPPTPADPAPAAESRGAQVGRPSSTDLDASSAAAAIAESEIDAQVARMLSAEHHFHRAEGHLSQKRYAEALTALRKANSLCPDQAEFIAELGWALFLAGGEPAAQEALDELERAIERAPKLDRGYLIRGWVCKALGRIDDAVRDFEQAVLCNPDCADAASELRALRPRDEESR